MSARTDEKLAAVLATVQAGRFTESPWSLFKHSYFRNETDAEARKAMLAWGKRHGVEVTWREGKTELAGQLYEVVWLSLTRK